MELVQKAQPFLKSSPVNNDIIRLEQEFREGWSRYDPARWNRFIDKVSDSELRLELTFRLATAELEFAFRQPVDQQSEIQGEVSQHDDEDERVRPSVHLFLFRYPELRDEPSYLVQLCVLEYARRLRHDKIPPRPESYLIYSDCVDEHLGRLLQKIEDTLPAGKVHAHADQCTVSQPGDLTVKDDSEKSISLEPLPQNLGCFLLVELISRGGMGFVYSAIDLRSATPVAVKVMRRDDAWSVYRFNEEFSLLSAVNHPNLVRLYEASVEGDLRYFSMEMIEGKTIDEWFQFSVRQRSDRWKVLRRALRQSASAIHYLHRVGAIHCDIKPTNIMITSSSRAVVLDLGLAVSENSPEEGIGTIPYSAPEVLKHKLHSQSSDWYSFGLLIYQVVSGCFEPKFLNDKNNEHIADTDDLREQLQDAPSDLVDLCCDLLRTDPDRRPTGSEVIRRLGGKPSQSAVATRFFGREEVLAELNSKMESVEANKKAEIAVLTGESGIGKSTVLAQWQECQTAPEQQAMESQRAEVERLVWHVRCFRQDKTPFRLINGLIQQIVASLKTMPRDRWQANLELHLASISTQFPQLRHLHEPTVRPSQKIEHAASSELARRTAMEELADWLTTLSHDFPIAILVDDAQWADESSLEWLAGWLQDSTANVLLIGVDESPEQRVLQLLERNNDSTNSSCNIPVASLSETECEDLLDHYCADREISISPQIREDMRVRSNGNPFLLRELFYVYSNHVKQFPVKDEEWLSRRFSPSFASRFTTQHPNAELVLQYLAVSDRPMGFHQIHTSARIAPKLLQSLLVLLESQGWITTRHSGFESQIEISHDRFRQAILASMPQARLARRHNRLARILSAEVPAPWSRMGAHFWEAELYREAAACYAQAARVALNSGGYEETLAFLERARHSSADRNEKEVYELDRLEAAALAGIGNSIEAAKKYETLMFRSDDAQKMVMKALAGEQWIYAGRLNEGMASLADVLAELGIGKRSPLQPRRWKLFFDLIRGAPVQKFIGKVQTDSEPFDELYAALNRMSFALTFLDNRLGPELTLYLKDYAASHGSKSDRAIAVLNYSLVLLLASRKLRRVAVGWLRYGRDLAVESNCPIAIGRYHFFAWLWKTERGRGQTASDSLRRSLEAQSKRKQSFAWDAQMTHWCRLANFNDRMELKQLRTQTMHLRQCAEQRNDVLAQYLTHVMGGHLSDLVGDDIEGGRESLEIARLAIRSHAFQMPRFYLWISRANQHLYEGNDVKAFDLLHSDWPSMKQASLLSHNTNLWLALSAKVCCALVRKNFADAKALSIRIRALRDAPYVVAGTAFELVSDAGLGALASEDKWLSTVQSLESFQLRQMANALRWHMGLHFENSANADTARGAFLAEGCVAPEKLMRILIPLPSEKH